jgi:hypothetical protein
MTAQYGGQADKNYVTITISKSKVSIKELKVEEEK